MTLVLASTSPQRRAILEQLGITFEVAAPTYVEDEVPGLTPEELVKVRAEGKARSVHRDGQYTLGVDTEVVLDERMYGKPGDRDDAARMLRELSGRTHTVVSGMRVLLPNLDFNALARTHVQFVDLEDETVEWYLGTGEWEGRAGAYAIQGKGARLVQAIWGDYLNVVGLPGGLLVRCLEKHAPNLLQTRR